MDMAARSNNRDDAALRFVAEHLEKRPEKINILIVISYGQPAACCNGGTEAEVDLRGIKEEYKNKGYMMFAAANEFIKNKATEIKFFQWLLICFLVV